MLLPIGRKTSDIAIGDCAGSSGAIGELIPLDILQLLQYYEIYDA